MGSISSSSNLLSAHIAPTVNSHQLQTPFKIEADENVLEIVGNDGDMKFRPVSLLSSVPNYAVEFNTKTIFVSIASYRDNECYHTIMDALMQVSC